MLGKLLLGAAASLLMIGSANAVTIYATTVNDYNEGAGVSNDRDDPTAALGAPGAPAPAGSQNFVALGLGGSIVLSFGQTFDTSATVYEITFGNIATFPENANAYVSNSFDGDFNGDPIADEGFTFIGNVSNLIAGTPGGQTLLVPGSFTFFALLDTTAGVSPDGFDLNSVGVEAVKVPEPGTLALLGAGLVGIGFAARRRRKSA